MTRYRSLWLPALLILVGAVALAANTNLVSYGSLYRLLDLWPVLVMLIGADLVLRALGSPRFATAAGLVLLLVAIAGSVAYVVAAPPLPSGRQTAQLSGSMGELSRASLSVALGGAKVTVHGEDLGEDLYQVKLDWIGQRPRVNFDRGSGELSIEDASNGLNFLFGPPGTRSVDVAVNRSIPWSVDVSGGATEATFHLTNVSLREAGVSGGANRVTLWLGPPQGTVGIDVSGGASTVTIDRPSGVNVRVEASGGANSVRLDDRRLSSFGDAEAETAGYQKAGDRYDVSVSGGASNVTVATLPG